MNVELLPIGDGFEFAVPAEATGRLGRQAFVLIAHA
jgi:hypothetical protein